MMRASGHVAFSAAATLALFAFDARAAWAAPDQPSRALAERAASLLERAPLIDTHNDLPYMIVEELGGDAGAFDINKRQPAFSADIPRLREGRVGAQYWSIYTAASRDRDGTALREGLRVADIALQLIASSPMLEQARTADDIIAIRSRGKIASLLGLEGGHMINGSLGALRAYHALGVRYMTLTHSDTLSWADASTDRAEHGGLTEFGEDVVREMNRLGMFVDISHVSPDAMRDVLRVSAAPVIFSHSNAAAVSPHARNAPDDVLARLKENGGVIHVNFIWSFVTPKHVAYEAQRRQAAEALRAELDDPALIEKRLAAWERKNPQPLSTIAEVADHIDHIRNVAGIDHIGIGADYYTGGADMVPQLSNVTTYPLLFAELLRRGYSDEDVLKIAGRNHLRAMRAMEATAARLQREHGPSFRGE